MLKLRLIPDELRPVLTSANIPNFIAVLLGLLFGLSFRMAFSREDLSVFTDSIRNVFLYGDAYAPAPAILCCFLPYILLIALGFTLYGRQGIPVVFFAYAFIRTLIVCIYIRAFGTVGVIYHLAVFGLSDLVLLPGMFITAAHSARISTSVVSACRHGGGRLSLRNHLASLCVGLIFPAVASVICIIFVPVFAYFLH